MVLEAGVAGAAVNLVVGVTGTILVVVMVLEVGVAGEAALVMALAMALAALAALAALVASVEAVLVEAVTVVVATKHGSTLEQGRGPRQWSRLKICRTCETQTQKELLAVQRLRGRCRPACTAHSSHLASTPQSVWRLVYDGFPVDRERNLPALSSHSMLWINLVFSFLCVEQGLLAGKSPHEADKAARLSMQVVQVRIRLAPQKNLYNYNKCSSFFVPSPGDEVPAASERFGH